VEGVEITSIPPLGPTREILVFPTKGGAALPTPERGAPAATHAMKVVILAGGLGTRLTEETETRPKPMVEIGGRPILWHIMKLYAHHGFREFVVALGYKGDVIKRYFLDYAKLQSNFTVNLGSGDVMRRGSQVEDWTVHLVDTGSATNTGGRLKRLAPVLGRETFMATYGDGVANVDIKALVEFHRGHGKLATTTAVRPPARFGGLVFEGDRIAEFTEKPQIGEGWINGGFFVLEPDVLEYIADDQTSWEREPMERLAKEGQLMAYRHGEFWQCMDTLRDLRLLEGLWTSGQAPWKVWPS
jgi:glucose-1-phosphate cytidylyltransferase